MAQAGREGGRFDDVRSFIGELYGQGLHAKRIDSLAGATLGTMTAASVRRWRRPGCKRRRQNPSLKWPDCPVAPE